MTFSTILGFVTAAITIVGAIIGVVKWRSRKAQLELDARSAEEFLKLSKREGFDFRSTHAMAAGLKISEARVRKACEHSDQIRRNALEKESWCLEKEE